MQCSPACYLCAHIWLLLAGVGLLPTFLPAHVGLLSSHAGLALRQRVSMPCLAVFAVNITHAF